ncbi:MAG TPA: TIGR00730 family Rossman fold protein, partial [Methylococcaceae bacterium]|nr:TIGR00730 family Rossman fold protein [Methylococcaceae bacterium]
HTRKARMAELADGFIALPGGYGTFEELFEILTWAQLGFHRKPIGILNTEGYFDPLIHLIDHSLEEGFIRPINRALVIDDTDPDRLIQRLLETAVPPQEAWLRSPETL